MRTFVLSQATVMPLLPVSVRSVSADKRYAEGLNAESRV
jgi:hypothetical protein